MDRYLSMLPHKKERLHRSISLDPPSPVDEEAAHRSMLEGIAASIDRLDDYTPSDYYSLSWKDQSTVNGMVDERMAKERDMLRGLMPKPKTWDYEFP